MRAYDVTIKPQDLTYLTWDECNAPSGLGGPLLKAREGSGCNAVYYKLPTVRRSLRGMLEGRGEECFNTLVTTRLMELLGIEHVECSLINADVKIGGESARVWVLRSKSILKPGEVKASLKDYYEFAHEGCESPLEFCLRQGWKRQLGNLFLIDYLTANRRRTGTDLEVIRGTDGTIRLAPFYGASHSLVSGFPGYTANVRPLEDLPGDFFLGGPSARENLKLLDCALDPLSRSKPDRSNLMRGLSQAAVHRPFLIQGSWVIIKRRWNELAREDGRREALLP